MKDVTPIGPNGSQRRNLWLAVALSALILIGFDAFNYFGWHQPAKGVQAALSGSASGAQLSASGPQTSKNAADVSMDGSPVAQPVNPVMPLQPVALNNDVLHLTYNLLGGKIETLTLDKFEAQLGKPGGINVLTGESPQPLATWFDSGWQSVAGMSVPDATASWQTQGTPTATSTVLGFKNASGQAFQRTLTLQPGSYEIDVVDRVWNTAQLPLSLRHYARVNRTGGADPKERSSWVNYSGPMGVVPTADGGMILHEGKFTDLKKTGRSDPVPGDGGWWGITGQYFMTGILPQGAKGSGAGDVTRDFRYATANGTDLYSADVTRDVTVPAGGQADVHYKIYAGPKQQQLLDAAGQGLDRAIDWGWFSLISKPLYHLLLVLHGIFHHWGLAIFSITLLLKIVTYPLASKSYRAMAKMKKIQPEIARLREQYGSDQQTMALKTMELYGKHKVNPMGGCWPTLIQVPIFFAMYKVVLVAFDFRHAPLNYTWIHDLSVMDPYYILPVLMGMSMYAQMQLQPTAADPTQAMVFKWMPIMFTVMFISFPAGLVFYWLCNNILSVAQQYYMLKKHG